MGKVIKGEARKLTVRIEVACLVQNPGLRTGRDKGKNKTAP